MNRYDTWLHNSNLKKLTILQKVATLLKNNPGLKASEIAKRINEKQGSVSSSLYRATSIDFKSICNGQFTKLKVKHKKKDDFSHWVYYFTEHAVIELKLKAYDNFYDY